MVSFDAIANASWGQDVLGKTGEIKKNTPYSKPLSFFSCGTLAKHIYQKPEDVRLGSAAVKEALLTEMKAQLGQDQQNKAEQHAKVCKSINQLIDLTNKSLKADKKIAEEVRLDIEKLKAQLTAPSAQEEKKDEIVAVDAAPASTASVLAEQSRTEEPVVANARSSSPRRKNIDFLREEAIRFTGNTKL